MLNDLRYAVRMLAKNPGFVAIAILSLAIGIGANSAIYSFADVLILRPLPVLKPSQVVAVNVPSSGQFGSADTTSYPDYVELRDKNRTFSGLVASAYSSLGFALTPATLPRMKFGMFVSGNFFQVMGVEPVVGRTFRLDEDKVPGRDAVAILSYDLWTTEFGANPNVAGQKVRLNGLEFTVIGVAPETFTGIDMLKPALFVPIAMSPALGDATRLVKRDNRWLDVRGRLKPGMGMAQAQADMSALATALRAAYPKEDETLQLRVKTEFQLRAEHSPPDTALVVMLSILALCVLLVACANVAGLLLGRATGRSREIAVRLALGAGRFTLVRQLLVENMLLALGGGAAGMLVAWAAVQFFNTLPIPTDIPVDLTCRLDDRALLFTLLVSMASTFLFGLVPALQGTRLDLIRALKEREGTGSRSNKLWGRNLIVAGQVAMSLVLLIISGVLVAGFRWQLEQGPGYRTEHLQLMGFDPGLVHYTDPQRDVFYKKLLEQVRRAPDVKTAALTSSVPMNPAGISTIGLVPEGHALKRGEHAFEIFDGVVSTGYFETLGIPLVAGRDFTESDQANTSAVAIVNEQFARHYWPNQNPIGKRLRMHDNAGKQLQVIGVAKTSKYIWISESPSDFIYLPFAQNAQSNMTLVAQAKSGSSSGLLPVLRQTVERLDRNMPLFDVRTMENMYETRAVLTPRLITQTVMAMGLLGLILAVVGLYGVVSYSVSRRSRELGIRMALGAKRRAIVGMVLGQGLTLGLAGLAVGLVIGIFACQEITTSTLFAFPINALPFVLVSLLLLVAVAVSAYAPARRASLVDPMRALRDE